ncbi:hypothetical protein KI387_037936, partial [Taxus chinensis]
DTRPVDQIQKFFFLNTQLPKVSYALRRANLATLDADQRLAISVEDDLIMSSKLKREPSKPKASIPSSSLGANSNQLIQKLVNDLIAIKKQLAQHAPYQDIPRKNFQPRNHLPSSQTRLAIEGPPLKVPVNATCEVLEPDDEEENGLYDEQEEDADEELEELGGSQVHFLTTEGMDYEDDYDERVVEMNNDSYVVMNRDQTNKKEKVVHPGKKSKEIPTTILVIARRGAPIPTASTQK